MDIACAGGGQRLRTRQRRRTRGQHIVNEQDAVRRRARGRERAPHRGATVCGGPSRLWGRRDAPTQQPHHGQTEHVRQGDRERPCLVVAAGRQPAPRERNPRHDIGLGDPVACCDRRSESARHVTPPRELQPVDGLARRPGIAERGSHGRHGFRQTRGAPRHGERGRMPAALAPRWFEHVERHTAHVAEGPRAAATPGAPAREHDVERLTNHAPRVARVSDTPRRRTSRRRRRLPA